MMMGGMMGGMGGGGVTGLLMMKEVREELKLDEDQVAELEDLGKAMMESMKNMRPQGGGGGGGGGQPPNPQDIQAMMAKVQKANEENEAKVEEILDPKQFDRLVGLYIQSADLQSLNTKLVATRLGITEEQKTKMAEIAKANGEKIPRRVRPGRSRKDGQDARRSRREDQGNLDRQAEARHGGSQGS